MAQIRRSLLQNNTMTAEPYLTAGETDSAVFFLDGNKKESDRLSFVIKILYVGDKPVEINAVLEPKDLNYPVEWSFSNEDAVSLEASEGGMKCTVTVLQPKGKNELKVVCHNLYTTIPVYLWER